MDRRVDLYGCTIFIDRVSPQEFLLVVDAINPCVTGFIDRDYISMTKDPVRYDNVYYELTRLETHFENIHGIHMSIEISVSEVHHIYIRLMSTRISIDHRDPSSSFCRRSFWYIDPIVVIFKDIAKKREKLKLFRLGLIDKESTLQKLSSDKIFDKHLAKLIYSFVTN